MATIWFRRIAPERYLLISLLLLAAVLWGLAAYFRPRPLTVVVFAVGKGDAMLVRAPSGKTLLIDGGSSNMPGVGEEVLVPNLLLLGVRRLDAVMITHPDADHLNGLPAVLDNLNVGMILDPGIPSETTAYRQVIELAHAKKIPVARVRAGSIINLGQGQRIRLLAPSDVPDSAEQSTNDYSVVGMLEYRQARMLLTGDLEAAGEQRLLATGGDLHADVLKVAHHGSKNGTSTALLRAAQPRIAIISCPGGGGEHPHHDTLTRLKQAGIRVWRTDVCGQITLSTFGRAWRIHTFQ